MKKYILIILLSGIAALSFAQQYPDRHSTSSTDAWRSCTLTQSPNPDRGQSHWVHYDLGSNYVLDLLTLWNYNDPSHLDNGVQEIAIDVSDNGITWTEAATATVSISDGSAYYQGEDILNLGGVSANHILITVLSNYGGSCSGFAELKITSAAILPVTLARFDIRCVETDDGVVIAWRSETEVGNDYYTIQRSTNAIDWEDVIDVSAKGQNGQGTEYYEVDKNITGLQYYRLVNTDIDGQRQYFEVKSIDCNDNGPLTMTVSNPFIDELVFHYYPNGEGEIIYTVESIDGRQVYQGRSGDSGQQTISIPSSEWINGTYVITISQNDSHVTKKVIKI